MNAVQCRYFLLGSLVVVSLSPLGLAQQNSDASITNTQQAPAMRDGQHDFDFELGSWKIHLKRLVHPLTGSTTWVEFDGTSVTRKVWDGERPNQFRGLDFEAAIDLLLALNVAKSLGDLSPLKSVGLHKLKGDRRGQWAMTVNDRWRICFEFRKGDAYEVEIVDYHRG